MNDFDQPNTFDDLDHQDTANAPFNVLGLIGLILACTCILSPIGLLLSLFALTKPRKALPIAGTIVGLVLSAVTIYAVYVTATEVSNPAFAARLETEFDFREIQARIRESGNVPASLNDPSLNFTEDVLTDYWGTPYAFSEDGQGNWTLTTYGPDQQPDSADDVTVSGSLGMFDSVVSEAVYARWKSSMKDSANADQDAPSDSPSEELSDEVPDEAPDNPDGP